MLDKIQLGSAKQLRNTLLITSFIGISFNALFANATGDFEFFGFKIPIDDVSIIPQLIGFLIIYFLIALIIRYSNEKFRDRYKEATEYSRFMSGKEHSDKMLQDINMKNYLRDNKTKRFFRKQGLYILDLYFPIILGLFAILKIFLFN